MIDTTGAGADADNGIFEYTYDPLGQLVAAVHGDAVKRYRYDELGNRVREWTGEKYDPVNWTEHKYNARNQLTQTKEGEQFKSYRYDRRGNLTNITQNGQLHSHYTYDARGMMSEAFTTGKGRAIYTYDGFLGRVNKLEYLQQAGQALPTDPTSEMRYLRDLTLPYDNLLMTSGTHNQSFVWGNGLISVQGEESFFYLQDHLGSPIRLLGADGMDASLAYDEFGVPLAGVMGKGGNPFGFTGYQMDSVSGLFYAQARYYQPSMGRFTAEDSARDGLNWYRYCHGNPLRYWDPSGHIGEDPLGLSRSAKKKNPNEVTVPFDGPQKENSLSPAPKGVFDPRTMRGEEADKFLPIVRQYNMSSDCGSVTPVMSGGFLWNQMPAEGFYNTRYESSDGKYAMNVVTGTMTKQEWKEYCMDNEYKNEKAKDDASMVATVFLGLADLAYVALTKSSNPDYSSLGDATVILNIFDDSKKTTRYIYDELEKYDDDEYITFVREVLLSRKGQGFASGELKNKKYW